MNTDNKETKNQTHWAPIFKDMGILMGVMGIIALLCKLIMMPFEINTPTDTLVSLVRKGGVSAVTEKGKGTEVKDAPFMDELDRVLGKTKPEDGWWDSLLRKIGLGSDDEPLPNNINAEDNTGRTVLMWAVYCNYNTPLAADVRDELTKQVVDELKAFSDAAKELEDLLEDASDEKAAATAKAKLDKSRAKLLATLNDVRENVEMDASASWNMKDVQRLYYVRALLNAPGIDVHKKDQDGFTALHWAAWSGMPFCSYMLVQAGLDINAKEDSGFTPLMLAAMRGNADTVEMLLSLGADPAPTNNKGETALSLAESAAASYHKSDTFVYTLIYSSVRNKLYKRTLRALKQGVPAVSREEIEKQMNNAWALYERQLKSKAKDAQSDDDANAEANKESEDAQIRKAETDVEHAAGEPAFSDNPDQENP